jgi:hypothetical protein
MEQELESKVAAIREALVQLQQEEKPRIKAIARSVEEIALVEECVASNSIPPNSPQHRWLSTYADEYGAVVNSELVRTQLARTALTSSSLMLSGTADAFSSFFPTALPSLRQEIEKLETRYNVREEVCAALEAHSKVIADEYLSAWEALALQMTDPVRGPAFIMRETITHLLHHLAPDDEVTSQTWWKPRSPEKTDPTRSDRIKYIHHYCILPDYREAPLTALQLGELERLYCKLNYAHSHAALDVQRIKDLLYDTQILLQVLLPRLSPCPHNATPSAE